MSDLALGRMFLGLLPGRAGDAGAIQTILEDLVARAHAAWPGVAVSTEDFLADVARAMPSDEDLATALGRLHGSDLYLAHACATGDPVALSAFEAAYARDIDGSLRRMALSDDLRDEVKQELRKKLFVAPADARPKIADYAGRAELLSWVRTAAVRTAISLLRKETDIPVEDELLAAVPSEADDPEVEHLKNRYRAELKQAFEEGLAALSVRQRNTLRHHFIDGLTIDEIGALYGVHKTTAFRWLEGAREALGDKTRSAFMRRIQGDEPQLQSILRLVRSQIELSVRRLLE